MSTDIQDRVSGTLVMNYKTVLEMFGCLFFAASSFLKGCRCVTEPFFCSVEHLHPRESRGQALWHNRDFVKVTIMLAAYFVSRCAFSASAASDYFVVKGFIRTGIRNIHMIQTIRNLQSIHISYGICNVHYRGIASNNKNLFH